MKGYGRKVRRSIAKCQYSDEVTELLARRIRQMPEYKHCTVETMGPFGLGAECCISVKEEDKLIGWLKVKDDCDGSWVYTDYSKPAKNTYPKGSIGALNGFNEATSPLPTDINEAIGLVFKHNG